MSGTCPIDHASVVPPTPTRARIVLRGPSFIRTVVALHEAFREALEMRRAAHRMYRLDHE